MAQRYDTVTFLSDLGHDDELVGVVRSILRDLAPHASVVDLAHGVAPFDVRGGSLALVRAVPYVAAGVVLASVDPGNDRPPVAIEVAGGAGVLVGPDNGLLAPAVAVAGGAERCVVLDRTEHHLPGAGVTFVARDVLAPVAAHLCNGIDLTDLGTPVDPSLLLPGLVPLPREEGGALHGEITWVDRFGNCQLNIGPEDVAHWGERLRVTIGETGDVRNLPVVSAFGRLGAGAPGLVVDANGMLSIALDRASAAAELGLEVGTLVVIGPSEADPGPTVPVRIRPAGA